ncbi:pyridine nucleotide-disulfide oxidoreductase [Pilimelia anulata]|uniref:Pyridine nucleotide-disulfide oxidoreductase n=1 Tax=Pilimelia anulata TaxID=53371 RepID=A0A8J3B578_9ACTN|nr:NAD(P)/FAD-dependent oxidoreductase [Pilimelia anulata]GGJ94462.1 pyridine nucleotide-disulfide oxidoreductase [Pilimelia anulata]
MDADVVVVGLGPAGEELAAHLLRAGLRVVGVEAGRIGGECANWGCVPSKMMVRAGNALAEAERLPALAGRAEVTPDWARVADRIRTEVLPGGDDAAAVRAFEAKGGVFVRGRARLAGPGVVEVDGREYRAARGVVLATGTRAAIPPIDGLADTPHWTNHEATHADHPPASLAVLGGGAVGVELAQAYARFGTEVTVLESASTVLAGEEPAAALLVAEALARDGVRVRCGVSVDRVTHADGRFTLAADGRDVTAERLLVAAGRTYATAGLGLETVGLKTDGPVEVDGRLRAGERLWAIGDVTGKGAFTHVATYQAGIAAADLLGEPVPPAEYRAVPRVTFTDPEVGAVGLTAAAAAQQGVAVQVYRASVPESARGWLHHAGNSGTIVLVADADADVLVGATSVGPAGGEVLGLLTLAVHARVPLPELRRMIHAYPTFHRAVADALRDGPT